MSRKPIISICGDSDLATGDVRLELAERLGKKLIDSNYRVLTGGMGGIMEAASRGARSSDNYQSGDVIGILPGYDPGDANEFVDVAVATGMDHLRNQLVATSDALVAIGGGAGTLTEMAFAWMLGRLVLAYQVEGWSGKVADTKLDHRIRYPGIREDRVFGVRTEEEVARILVDYLPLYRRGFSGMD